MNESLRPRSQLSCLVALAAMILSASCATTSTPAPPSADAPAPMHLFLLAGQSNMAGRGEVKAKDRATHPRIWMLDQRGAWVPAAEPLHFDKPVAGVGPGLAFARVLVESDPAVVVGLVPTAVGGSPISTWEPGGWHDQTNSHPYDDALARARIAARRGEFKAILWHQGESDANAERAPLYGERLIRLVERFRGDLGAPDLPFLVGGLGCFAGVPWSPYRAAVDSVHRSLPTILDNVVFVPADGLGHKGDSVHFDSPATRELGRRFARAYLESTDPDAGEGRRRAVPYPPGECARAR
ncbi:MAG TPA: sialate O-acetylesterase [Longimicrobiaceae bacterium]